MCLVAAARGRQALLVWADALSRVSFAALLNERSIAIRAVSILSVVSFPLPQAWCVGGIRHGSPVDRIDGIAVAMGRVPTEEVRSDIHSGELNVKPSSGGRAGAVVQGTATMATTKRYKTQQR
jgi:hypothetical protein